MTTVCAASRADRKKKRVRGGLGSKEGSDLIASVLVLVVYRPWLIGTSLRFPPKIPPGGYSDHIEARQTTTPPQRLGSISEHPTITRQLCR